MNVNTANTNHSVKIILLGDSGTGKSTLFQRLQVNRKWVGDLRPTIGMEMIRQTLTVSNERMGLQIWDFASTERLRRVSEKLYRGNDAALIVYDITNKNSFTNLQDWLKRYASYGEPDATIILLGNKCELEENRQVSYEEGRLFAEKNGFVFLEVSAKTLENVDYLLRVIGQELLGRFIEIKEKGAGKNYEDIIVSISGSKDEDPKINVNVNNNPEKMSSNESPKKNDNRNGCNIW